MIIPTLFLKSDGDIAIAFVRPSHHLLLNHLTKFNQIWCVNCSHDLGVIGACNGLLFWPRPPPPLGRGQKVIIKLPLQSQFQRFLNQTLCIISQMKDIKHIRWPAMECALVQLAMVNSISCNGLWWHCNLSYGFSCNGL